MVLKRKKTAERKSGKFSMQTDIITHNLPDQAIAGRGISEVNDKLDERNTSVIAPEEIAGSRSELQNEVIAGRNIRHSWFKAKAGLKAFFSTIKGMIIYANEKTLPLRRQIRLN